MKRSIPRNALAIVVAISLLMLPGAFAAPAALLQGRVLGPDGLTPMTGVVVNLVDAKTDATFPSVPSNERGVFKTTAPAGSYGIVAATPHGAYVAAGPLTLREGSNPPLSLTLRRASAAEGEPAPPPAAPGAKKDDLAPWAKWTIVGGIVVAGLLVIDAVTEDETPASGFTSGGS